MELFEVLTSYAAMYAVAALILGVLTALAVLRIAGLVREVTGFPRGVWMLAGSLSIAGGLWGMFLAITAIRTFPGHVATTLRLAIASLVLAVGTAAMLTWTGGAPAPRPRRVLRGAAAGVLTAGVYVAGAVEISRADPAHVDPVLLATGAAVLMAVCTALVWLTPRAGIARRHASWWPGRLIALAAGLGLGAGLVLVAWAFRAPGVSRGSGGVRLAFPPAVILSAAAGAVVLLVAVLVAAAIDERVRRRRAETEALRRSEDRFRSLVQASSQIVWTTAPDGQMVEDQVAWSDFTGQSPDEYRGWGWFSAVHPDDREATARLWEGALADRNTMELEHRVRRHDGRYRDCLARVVPVMEPDGRVREWVGTHTDVTDRARLKEERNLMAEAGRVLSSSLDPGETLGAVARLIVPRLADWCVIDLCAETDGLRRVVATHVDPQKAHLLQGLEPQTEGNHGAARVLRTKASELVQEVTEELLQEIAGDADHARLLQDVGLTSMVAVPLIARGQVLGVLTIALCGSAEHYDLRDLAFAEELARRSAVAIDNARLYAGAQRAIRDRDEILGVVSHDLRNPVNVITLSSELLLDVELPPEKQRHQLEIIRRGAQAMNRLIQDLLDVSRMDAGGLAIDRQEEDPALLVSETCDLMRPLAVERGQRLTCKVAADLPLVAADRDRIQQVLSNLIGNSIKFVEPGGTVHVQVEAAGEEVRISVMDTGPGIQPEDLPRLFERHWQGRSTAHLGAGLGLAISKAIVEAHGGRIWAESEVGRGTCVHFMLPARPPATAQRLAAQIDDSVAGSHTGSSAA